jgi:hypothetical protein
MIVYLKNSEIDRALWDNCIRNSGVSRPYPYSWYLDLMAPGWEALIDDDYDSVFPVPCSVIFGQHYIDMPPFIQQLGAFSPDKPASGTIVEFLDYMPDLFKLIDLSVGQRIDYPGYKITEKANLELNLSASYEELWGRFSQECRRIIEKATKKRYELSVDVSPEELTNLCIANKGLNMRRIKPGDFIQLQNLMRFCTGNKKGKILGVRGPGKRLLYGIFLVRIPGSVTILFTANSPAGIEKHIEYFVINEIIKDNASTSTTLDFAGTSHELPVSSGQSFGGIEVPYYRIYRNRFFLPVWLMR